MVTAGYSHKKRKFRCGKLLCIYTCLKWPSTPLLALTGTDRRRTCGKTAEGKLWIGGDCRFLGRLQAMLMEIDAEAMWVFPKIMVPPNHPF